MATDPEVIKERALNQDIQINYPPSTSYPVKEDEKYWAAVSKNHALVNEMNNVAIGQLQERQVMEGVQRAAAQGAAEVLEQRQAQEEREARRLAGIQKAREAKRGHKQAEGREEEE